MSQGSLFDDETLRGPAGAAALQELRARALKCTRCRLSQSRTTAVFGEGKAERPAIAFVGEGPGAEEDRAGLPFVGRSGKLLDRVLQAMGLTRGDVYICNVVKCRPPENRKPEQDEVAACNEYLVGQLRAVRPQVIVALGATAAETLLKVSSNRKLGDMRGHWFAWEGVPLRVTYHPAYILRNPVGKPGMWEDMQAVMQRLKEMESGRDGL